MHVQKTNLCSLFSRRLSRKVSYTIAGNSLTLSNEAITGEWGITDNSVFLKSVTNKYDGQTVNLEDVLLFAIELDGGKQLTNLDFKLKSNLKYRILSLQILFQQRHYFFPGWSSPQGWLRRIKT
ncbi:MAG: hypothetical protein IPJ37_17415 [Bacteroidales bacterium]|nr:hypothetical protein [Bacteroidales bacterium]